MSRRIQLRRGTAAEWSAANPTLAPGEVGLEIDGESRRMKIGPGRWNDLGYSGGEGGGGGGEWSAETVGQAEAEAGVATTRRAWTAQRVFQAIAAWWAASAAATKLAGIAAGATANAADVYLLSRANHTGTQGAETITDLAAVATSGAYADLSGKPTLGAAAALSVGTAAGTVAAGDDARFHASVTLGASLTAVLSLTGQALAGVDAGADRIVFWDDSAGEITYLQASTGLAITGTSLAIDSTVATLTGAQTLTNKTLGDLKEGVYTISDGPSVDLNPANGPLQQWTLTTNRTPTATNFANGQSMKLRVSGNYTITWPSVVWTGSTNGASGTAPTAPTAGFLHVELWKESNVLYGASAGYTAS